MRMVFLRAALLEAVQIAGRTASSLKQPEIISHVRIVADDQVRLYSTDLEVGVRQVVKGEVLEPGSITVPARKLSDIISALPELNSKGEPSTVSVSVKPNDRVEISSGMARFRLAGLPDDEFPRLPEIGSGAHVVAGSAICGILSKVAYAASSSEIKAFLCGVRLATANRSWIAVATDGKRIAVAKHNAGKALAAEINVTIPKTVVNLILRVFSEVPKLKLEVADNQIILGDDNVTMAGRLLEDEYPDYMAVVESATAHITVIAETNRLIQVLRRVSLLANAKTPAVKILAKDGNLVVTSNTPEMGNARENMPVSIDVDGIEIAVNASFILDAVSQISTDSVVMGFRDEKSPVIIKEQDGDDYLCIIMPMKPGVVD